MEWLTTSTILERLRDYENRNAWDQFAERFRQPIVRFARQMGLSSTDAEDAAQETLIAFAEAYRRGQYHRDRGRLSQWLFGIAYRQSLNARRKHARNAARIVRDSSGAARLGEVADEQAATSHWETVWEESLLDDCLRQVRREVEPVTYRAFELSVRDGQPAADVATALEVPVKTVYNAKHRVLKRIRELRAILEDTETQP